MTGRTVEDHTQALADYLPGGRGFEAKNINDSEFRKLLRGVSHELFNAQGYLAELEGQYFPDKTEDFISEWERALKIPDDCFPGTGSLTERRRDITVKLASLGVQTAADYVRLGGLYGIPLTVSPLSDENPLPPGVSVVDARYMTVITGPVLVGNFPPYEVPFFLSAGETVLQCLFKKLDPANCGLLYRNA